MKNKRKGLLQIILILPKERALLEYLAFTGTEERMLQGIRETARKTGHSLGVYYTASRNRKGKDVPAQIHSKIIIIDDRFMTLGSANICNRSLGLDTEMNLSWESSSPNDELTASIRNTRVDLLKEHAGLSSEGDTKFPDTIPGLVETLNEIAKDKSRRLRVYPRRPLSSFLASIDAHKLYMDPEKSFLEEDVDEILNQSTDSVFIRGITMLYRSLVQKDASLKKT